MWFNIFKCCRMSIYRSMHPNRCYYELGNRIPEQVEENPYNGVTTYHNLRWACHIDKIYSKSNSVLGFIQCNLRHANHDLMETANITLVVLFYSLRSLIPWREIYIETG